MTVQYIIKKTNDNRYMVTYKEGLLETLMRMTDIYKTYEEALDRATWLVKWNKRAKLIDTIKG